MTEWIPIFGDVHWLLCFMVQSGIHNILAKVFPDQAFRSRVFVHILHTILKDGSNVTCDKFLFNSVAAQIFPELTISTLRSD